jgi:SAM-dependent methyltransferase
MTEADRTALPFTGERFTPECVREIWYEHWHRYVFARRFVAGKRVLDAACGEGYGSALLASAAAEVVGVDIDPASITHARGRYGALSNLSFEVGDATALDFPDRRFDVVVSFETLEHVAAQQNLLAGCARVLADDGVLLISSPDKREYSEVAGFHNEFHVRELYRDEFVDLVRPHFPSMRLYGQKLLFQSAVWSLDHAGGGCEAWTASRHAATIAGNLDYAPLYFIALCAKRDLPERSPALSLLGDREESVYAHYNHEVRKNMSAGERIAELERELDRLRDPTTSGPPREAALPRNRWRWWRRGRPNE